MKNFKNTKGITLIALVITIIILIILSGISISILTGQDGLIEKAKTSKQNYQNASSEEQTMVNAIGIYTELNGDTNGYGTNIKTKTAKVINPGTEDITISGGTYLEGDQIIKGDPNLKAENIKEGVQIFNVTGTLTEGFTEDELPAQLTYSLSASSSFSFSAMRSKVRSANVSGGGSSTIYIPTFHMYKRISATSGVTGYKDDGTSYTITNGDISEALYVKVDLSVPCGKSESYSSQTFGTVTNNGSTTVTIYKQ